VGNQSNVRMEDRQETFGVLEKKVAGTRSKKADKGNGSLGRKGAKLKRCRVIGGRAKGALKRRGPPHPGEGRHRP